MNILTSGLRDPSVEEFDTRTLLKKAAQQANKRHYEDFLIVDVDAHHYETESLEKFSNTSRIRSCGRLQRPRAASTPVHRRL